MKIVSRFLGYKNIEDYYKEGSTFSEFNQIKINIFAINSLDDPVFCKSNIPFEEFKKYDNMILAATTTGGHVGWFTGFFSPKRWFHIPCFEFLDAISV